MSLLSSLLLVGLLGAKPAVDVVYPRVMPPDTIPRIEHVDSNFVFGSVTPPDSRLWIDDTPVKVWPNGAFLTFQPVDWKKKSYRIRAVSTFDTTEVVYPFATRPTPPQEALKAVPAKAAEGLIELSDAPLRTDPRGAYSIFPSAGTRVWAARVGDNWKIPIGPDNYVYAEGKAGTPVKGVKAPPPCIVHQIKIDTLAGRVVVRLPLDHKILVSYRDETDPNRLVIDFYGAVSRIDRIWYPSYSPQIKEMYWQQLSSQVLRLDIRLAGPLWGYKGSWEGGGFTLTLKPAPDLNRGFEGLRIAIDAGHGGSQDGAIGPTRHKEKDVNLFCAIALKERLEKLGSIVTMTRSGDSTIGLSERVASAEAAGADMLVSLHHNALPDGVDPFGLGPFGTSVHYYRAQSRDLGNAIHNAIVGELRVPDEGIYYDNLALARPSALPAVLVESAYMMLPDQEMMVSAPDYPSRLAAAVSQGILKFLYDRSH